MADVRRRGDAAVDAWTRKLDGIDLHAERPVGHAPGNRRGAKTCRPRISSRRASTPPTMCGAWRKSRCRASGTLEVEPGVTVAQARPAHRIDRLLYSRRALCARFDTGHDRGAGASGGSASELLRFARSPTMNCLPQPTCWGSHDLPASAAHRPLRRWRTARSESRRVEKIFGPGNRFVTAAKQIVSATAPSIFPRGRRRPWCWPTG